jgi:hypothetical protein
VAVHKERQKFRSVLFEPYREMIKACKSSRRTTHDWARFRKSGNNCLPFLIWDELTYPDFSLILWASGTVKTLNTQMNRKGPQRSLQKALPLAVFFVLRLERLLSREPGSEIFDRYALVPLCQVPPATI